LIAEQRSAGIDHFKGLLYSPLGPLLAQQLDELSVHFKARILEIGSEH
jgi:hypothetical protein